MESIEEEPEETVKSVTPEKVKNSKYGTRGFNKSKTPVKVNPMISRITQKTNATNNSSLKPSKLMSTGKKKTNKKKKKKKTPE